MSSPVRVLIVDDNPSFRRVGGAVVEASPGFELAGEAADRSEAEALLADGLAVDVALVDVNLGRASGIDLAASLTSHHDGLRVALISTMDPDDLPPRARTCGAFAFLPKQRLGSIALEELLLGLYDWPA